MELEFYRKMFTIRRLEEAALELFSKGLLNGTVHTCIGQEACAAGVISALNPAHDIVFSNHRGHGHYLALTGDVEGLIAELMGRQTGVCGGVGGSQHLHAGNFYSNGIQGGIVPVATGMAMAEKYRGTGAIVVVFIGDGTMGEGVVYESFNIAAKWALPILFVLENNQYAQTTPVELAHAGSLADRAKPFGIESAAVAATSPGVVLDAARPLVEMIRKEQRPAFLYLDTYRLAAHSKGDDPRPTAEVDAHWKMDPLARLAETIDPQERREIEQAVDERMHAAIEAAKSAPSQDFNEYRRRMVTKAAFYR